MRHTVECSASGHERIERVDELLHRLKVTIRGYNPKEYDERVSNSSFGRRKCKSDQMLFKFMKLVKQDWKRFCQRNQPTLRKPETVYLWVQLLLF